MAGGAQHLETRHAVELRAAGRRLAGLAAVFDQPARVAGFSEVVRPGAFRASLAAGKDILALADHDAAKVLGRTRSGTLRLSETARGLEFELDLPNTTAGNDVLELVTRGDAGGMSFGFRVVDERWPTRDRRELVAVDLVEISVVSAVPAYSGTGVVARSRPPIDPAVARRMLFRATIACR